MEHTTLAHTDSGNGPALVFLHGFCESKELWADFVQPFTKQFRVIAFDLPGHGESAVDQFTMEAQAEQVFQSLQGLHLGKFLLVGHSMGGYVALAFAKKYPELLHGMCLFHSSALPDSPEKRESRDKTIEFVQKHGVDKFMETFVSPLFAASNRQACHAAIEKMQAIGKATPEATITGCLQAMRDRADRTSVLKEITCPVLFIAGKEDPAVPLDATLQQCHLPAHSMVYFLDAVGHMGMFERTAATQVALLKFAETVLPQK